MKDIATQTRVILNMEISGGARRHPPGQPNNALPMQEAEGQSARNARHARGPAAAHTATETTSAREMTDTFNAKPRYRLQDAVLDALVETVFSPFLLAVIAAFVLLALRDMASFTGLFIAALMSISAVGACRLHKNRRDRRKRGMDVTPALPVYCLVVVPPVVTALLVMLFLAGRIAM